MPWTAATQKIITVTPNTVTASPIDGINPPPARTFTPFDATISGFSQATTQLMFVRSTGDGRLKDFQVVPCVRTTVDPANPKKITFEACFDDRDPGDYHLIAWDPTLTAGGNAGFNQTTVFEFAVSVTAAPGAASGGASYPVR